MRADEDRTLSRSVGAAAHPLNGSPADFEPLLERIGARRIVLLGESTHGTHEFYRLRAEITKRLIREKGFRAILIEGDWPDAWRVHRYVTGRPGDADATDALAAFRRFPQWMWRNADVLDLVGWLREHNDGRPPRTPPVGFYGLDLYSLHQSIDAIVSYLDLVDPPAARRARSRYDCFDHQGLDPQEYGYGASLGLARSCEREVLDQLLELRRRASEYARRDGRVFPEDAFFAERNAVLVHSAERYYRAMMSTREDSWNVRDSHMADTLFSTLAHLDASEPGAKAVVWAHNSHVGDARATSMAERGELNVGQLVREHWGDEAVLVGFTTSRGTVTAADDWDGPARRMTVRDPLDGSIEALLSETGHRGLYLDWIRAPELLRPLSRPRLERAIGVIYRPRTERQSHYFDARVADQFDALFHLDRTRAVEPLERSAPWEAGELAETYPSAL